MPNPLLNIVERIRPTQKARHVWAHLRQEVIGLARDYWKDGNWEKPPLTGELDDLPVHAPVSRPASEAPSKVKSDTSASPFSVTRTAGGLWSAHPGEISERMWGHGYVSPGDEHITNLLITPLGINKDMNILDLSAGLGGRMRKMTEEYGVYINGLEPDADIAARGMSISVAAGRSKQAAIEAYDPMNLTSTHKYDCVIARETIYRVADKQKFINSIVACCKPKAQISFTDYVVNPEVHDAPNIAAWRAFEKGADPVGLVEMAEMWAKAGISIRVHDDQTDYYKKEVRRGLLVFAKFMAADVKPDEPTRKAIERRVMIWAHRMAAIDAGMRFYRFYGMRA